MYDVTFSMGLIVNNFFLAIPFYFLWNFLAPIYAPNLPDVYKDIPFWHIVGLFTLFAIFRLALLPKRSETSGRNSFYFKKFDFGQPQWSRSTSTKDGDFAANDYIKDVTPKS